MHLDASVSSHPMYRDRTVSAAVANLIENMREGQDVEVKCIIDSRGQAVKLETARMCISKCCQVLGIKVTTRVTDSGLRIWRIE